MCKCFFYDENLNLLDDPADDGNGVYHVCLKSQQVMECALKFQPSEVCYIFYYSIRYILLLNNKFV